jgi:oligoendopeptidase F
MSSFLANKFSKDTIRLLISFLVPFTGFSNPLITNEEKNMSPPRSQVSPKDQWNVESLYQDVSQWLSDLKKVQGNVATPRWPELKRFQGKLADPKMLAEWFEYTLSLERSLDKLSTYAHLKQDEDLGNDDCKTNYGLIRSVGYDYRMETAWFEPELLSLSKEQIDRLQKDPSLVPYRFHLDRIFRMRPHILSSEQEQLLALSAKATEASHRAFGALNNADLVFPSILDSKGEAHPLTHGSYGTYLHSSDRTLRKNAVLTLHRVFQAHANTVCELLQGQVQSHLFQAKARGFADCATAALFTHKIDPKVIRQLIATVRKSAPRMHEYLALRKSVLKLDTLHAYDLASPLTPAVDLKMSYEEARAAVVESVKPLGAEYQSALRKGLYEDRWVDPYENSRKRSGAYSSGCYDSMPYILMNFHGSLLDTMTLAHEAGHSMHTFLSHKNQPYLYSQYPIFVAEVASTFNEQLLMDHLMQKVKTKEERAYLISDQIDRIRSTLYRQTVFAEFELKIHELAERGEPLTPTLLNQIYRQLLSDYYGPLLTIDPEMEIEWARIPHFYSNFYVYQYATGLSAAMALHKKVAQSKEAKDKYLQFLSSGGSQYPLDLLKVAGVDMTTSAPVEAALERFEQLVHELKKNLGTVK